MNNPHLIDAKNKILGRLATGVAEILMGKNKGDYTPNLAKGDEVVVINAAKIVLSGKKEKQKIYWHHSGYPGGLRSQTASQIRSKRPEQLIRHAVLGMLPKNRLGKIMAKKLQIHAGEKPVTAQITEGKSAPSAVASQ